MIPFIKNFWKKQIYKLKVDQWLTVCKGELYSDRNFLNLDCSDVAKLHKCTKKSMNCRLTMEEYYGNFTLMSGNYVILMYGDYNLKL